MPRARSPENAGLPKRWRHKSGAYYYQVPPGLEHLWDGKKTFRLGGSLPEAYRTWAERINVAAEARTIGALLDRYAQQVIPTKKPSTQTHNNTAIKPLRAVFDKMALTELKPRHVYQYVEKRNAKTAARREIEILSHAFTKAVEWGFIDKHPFKGEVRLTGEKARTRYIEDWEIVECLALTPRRKAGSVLAIQAAIRITLLTGMRRGDLLRLTLDDLKEDGIHVTPRKTETTTGKRQIISWTAELRAAVAMAKSARPMKFSRLLFCTRDGTGYFNEETGRAGGWDSMWAGFMKRVLEETKVTERFTEHDLRAKCASDAKTLEHAQMLLAHADSRITQVVYRRKPDVITPLR